MELIPLERLALELLPQGQLLGNVARLPVQGLRLPDVVVLVVVVHPGFDDANEVLREKHLAFLGNTVNHGNTDRGDDRLAGQLAKVVGHVVAVDVAHVGAGDEEDAPAALPDLNGGI